jgi:predicted amino acid dehydrogenase
MHPDMVAPGTVVIDVTQPSNIPPSERGAFRARDVVVADGGVVRIPNYSSTYDFGEIDCRDTYACLAETYLFAREGIRQHSVGRPSTDWTRTIERVASKHGVTPRSLTKTPVEPRPPGRQNSLGQSAAEVAFALRAASHGAGP